MIDHMWTHESLTKGNGAGVQLRETLQGFLDQNGGGRNFVDFIIQHHQQGGMFLNLEWQWQVSGTLVSFGIFGTGMYYIK